MPNPRQTREEAMEEFLSLMEYIENREAELAANQQRIAELKAALEDEEGTLVLRERDNRRRLAVLEEIRKEAEQKKAEAAAKVARGLQRLTQLQKERVALELAIAKAEAERGENSCARGDE